MIVLSGSGSGIGAAVRARLEKAGQDVVGVDIRNAEVIADLATPEGRAAAIAAVERRSGGVVDGVVACAGVGPQTEPAATIVSVNYFGAVALLDGMRASLARGKQPAAVAVSSNSATIVPGADGDLYAACLAGDEERARALAGETHGSVVYAASKRALAVWVRRQAVLPDWAGAGVRLNAIAPGAVQTPLLQAGLEHPILGEGIRNFPIPLQGFASPDQIAGVIAFLLGPDASFCCGSVWTVDGGSDAMFRSDSY